MIQPERDADGGGDRRRRRRVGNRRLESGTARATTGRARGERWGRFWRMERFEAVYETVSVKVGNCKVK
jgi:hypothetical protein